MGIAIKLCYNVKTGGDNMYLSFWDCVVCFIKSFIITMIISPLFILIKINCDIGVAYCNYLEVPLDFGFTVMSPGLAFEIAFVLSLIEFILIYFIFNKLSRVKFIKKIYNSIYYF